LELLAALVATRLLRYFCQATNYDISKTVLWSDSEITLAWIRGDPNGWKTFVCNRVTEIVESTNPSQWRHYPGSENPADFLSRGLHTRSEHLPDMVERPPLASRRSRLLASRYSYHTRIHSREAVHATSGPNSTLSHTPSGSTQIQLIHQTPACCGMDTPLSATPQRTR
jgi:hypothetical protein